MERGSFRMDLSTKFGKEIPSRILREKGSVCTSVLGSCRAGMAWKTAKSRKWKKNGNRNGKRPRAGQENSITFPFLGHFFAIFAPVQLGAVFHFDFHFFSISGFWPFSMPYQPGRILTLHGLRPLRRMLGSFDPALCVFLLESSVCVCILSLLSLPCSYLAQVGLWQLGRPVPRDGKDTCLSLQPLKGRAMHVQILGYMVYSAFLKHAFREVTCGFCKGAIPRAPPRPSPGP